MEDKGKGFSLRQKKSRQAAPKQISGPIQTISQASRGPTRPNVNGKVETSTANTSDLVKRRYSTRFTNLPDFSNADAPPVPSLPALPAQFAQSNSRPSSARQNQHLHHLTKGMRPPTRLQLKKSDELTSFARGRDYRERTGSIGEQNACVDRA